MKKNKQQKKRNKKYTKKYTTDNRLDMSKGGRVGYRIGNKVEIDPRTGKALPRTSIERPVEEIVKKPIVSSDKSKSKVVESITESEPVQTSQQTATTSEEISALKGGGKEVPDEITSIERIPTEEELKKQGDPEKRRKAAEKAAKKAAEEAAEEAAKKAAEEAARKAASKEIMRETTPPSGTYTTTDESGEVVNLPNMLDWEKEYKKNNPRPTAGGLGGLVKRQKWDKQFEIARQTQKLHQQDKFQKVLLFLMQYKLV